MIRKSYFITERQERMLEWLKGATGLSISEMVRRALDHYIELMIEAARREDERPPQRTEANDGG